MDSRPPSTDSPHVSPSLDGDATAEEVPSPATGFEDGAPFDYEVVTIVEPSGFVEPERPRLLPELAEEIQVLTAQEELEELWAALALDETGIRHEGSPAPHVDFDQNVVFLVTEGKPAHCADPLALEPEDDVLWFRFQPFEGGCHTRQGWSVYVVEVVRDHLPDQFTVARDYYGLEMPDGRKRQAISLVHHTR